VTGQAYYGDGITYGGFPADDQSDYDISADFPAAIAFISHTCRPDPAVVASTAAAAAAAGDGGGGGSSGRVATAPVLAMEGRNVMVHCKAGASRSAAVVLAYLVNVGMPLEDAVGLVRSKREIAPNNGFLQRLVLYANSKDYAAARSGAP
jgi:hypothetical protein